MRMWSQIFAGALALCICGAIHIAILAFTIDWLETFQNVTGPAAQALLILAGFGAVLVGHTAQVWIWAGSFVLIGALKRVDEAAYFALVSTTTLGYGDITLDAKHRIFGAMSAVSGLLTFGLSTAFLVSLIQGVMFAGR